MQFVWQYVNDMVGKGVGMGVMAELFFYACIAFTPMAFPLAILLASLMTFGNLGEHLELLAIKASGISLIRIMKPLIAFAVVLAGISIVLQNDIAPHARAKMYTIVLSLRQKSPELDIPEGAFYKDIPGYNVYVRHKNPDGLLRDLMIYNYSDGFENAEVIVADSGRLSVAADKKHLALTLHDGSLFRNWGNRRSRTMDEKIPYMRETFHLRNILISFDGNFTMIDESVMGSSDISKNMTELSTFVDSVRYQQDSIQQTTAAPFKSNVYGSAFRAPFNARPVASPPPPSPLDSLFAQGFPHYYRQLDPTQRLDALRQAKHRTEQIDADYNFLADRQTASQKQILSHLAQYYQRYAMALSCILFFFIGAPLGAIIRKGGIGMPAVLSVFLYLLYYTVDTFGLKMVRQAVLPVWQGVWLSTALLIALGAFFTYKAVNDSTMIDPDAWKVFLRKLSGQRETRHYTRKEVIMTPPDYPQTLLALQRWNLLCQAFLLAPPPPPLYKRFPYGLFGSSKILSDPAQTPLIHPQPMLDLLIRDQEAIIDDLANSSHPLIIGKLMDYPLIRPLALPFLNKAPLRLASEIVFPVGIPLALLVRRSRRQIALDLRATQQINEWLIGEIEKLNS
jgi:lipopolysaccharide export system permease protein